jgi:hypothetical protein
MADLVALRDYVVARMRAPGDGRPPLTVNALFEALQHSFPAGSPASRTTLYGWLRPARPREPTPALLECIPAFSAILGVSEYELYHIAKILPREIDTAASLLAAANDFRHALSMATSALANAGLSSDGVAIVVDRVMNYGLDFRIRIWPVVRGYTKEIHLHSWIVLEPVEPIISRRRGLVAVLASYDERGQREYIRYNVITETLWRSLGLRWRTEPGPEWPYGDLPALCIEVPIAERNRLPVQKTDLVPHISPDRILVLSAPFGHAELIAALVGEGLGFGTIDLRYQGFPESPPSKVVARFCREKLIDGRHYAWSIAEPSDTLRLLEDDIIAAAETHLIVGISYGSRTRTLGAEVWGLSPRELLKSAEAISSLLRRINDRMALISIEYEEQDYISGGAEGSEQQIDFNLLTDHVRFSAAEVLNYIYEKCNGPPADTWGISFDDLRHGLSSKAQVPPRATRVRWCSPGEF